MKLLLRRSQKPGVPGKVTFTLAVRADLTDAEKSAIMTYRLGKVLLYERNTFREKLPSWFNIVAFIRHGLTNLTINFSDLECGKHIGSNDILHMLSVEAEIKKAAETFKSILKAAQEFTGEEVIDFS